MPFQDVKPGSSWSTEIFTCIYNIEPVTIENHIVTALTFFLCFFFFCKAYCLLEVVPIIPVYISKQLWEKDTDLQCFCPRHILFCFAHRQGLLYSAIGFFFCFFYICTHCFLHLGHIFSIVFNGKTIHTTPAIGALFLDRYYLIKASLAMKHTTTGQKIITWTLRDKAQLSAVS